MRIKFKKWVMPVLLVASILLNLFYFLTDKKSIDLSGTWEGSIHMHNYTLELNQEGEFVTGTITHRDDNGPNSSEFKGLITGTYSFASLPSDYVHDPSILPPEANYKIHRNELGMITYFEDLSKGITYTKRDIIQTLLK